MDVLPRILRPAIAHAPTAIIVTDIEGDILACSDAVAGMLGYSSEAFTVCNFYDILAGSDHDRVPSYLKEERCNGGIKLELTALAKSGEIIPLSVDTSLFNVEDNIYRVVSLTKRNSMSAVGDETFEQPSLSSLFPDISSDPDIVFHLDPEGYITYVNSSWLRKLGYTRDDIKLGLHFTECVEPEDHEAYISQFVRLLSGEAVESFEATARTADGRLIPIIISASSVMSNGAVTSIHGVAMDITEHKRAEQKLIIMEKLNTLGELAGGVVHDFNNILSMILGYLKIHASTCSETDCCSIMANIENAVTDGVQIVRRINNFTQMTALSDQEPVFMTDLLESAIRFTRPTWSETTDNRSPIEIKTEFTSNTPVLASPSELREVFSNIILNAVQSITGEGTISLTTSHDHDYVVAAVTDTGCGMDAEALEKLYEPFFTTKEHIGGTGLGMSVCYGIVNKLGGEIRVESKIGSGTTVSVALPIAAPDTALRESAQLDPTTYKGPSRHILVVDDEENICEILSEILKAAGHAVTTVISAEDALKLLTTHFFDLIISDLNLKGMSGWDMAKAIRDKSPAQDIIILTGWGSNIEELNLREHVVRHILPKPIDFTLLMNVAHRIFNDLPVSDNTPNDG